MDRSPVLMPGTGGMTLTSRSPRARQWTGLPLVNPCRAARGSYRAGVGVGEGLRLAIGRLRIRQPGTSDVLASAAFQDRLDQLAFVGGLRRAGRIEIAVSALAAASMRRRSGSLRVLLNP